MDINLFTSNNSVNITYSSLEKFNKCAFIEHILNECENDIYIAFLDRKSNIKLGVIYITNLMDKIFLEANSESEVVKNSAKILLKKHDNIFFVDDFSQEDKFNYYIRMNRKEEKVLYKNIFINLICNKDGVKYSFKFYSDKEFSNFKLKNYLNSNEYYIKIIDENNNLIGESALTSLELEIMQNKMKEN